MEIKNGLFSLIIIAILIVGLLIGGFAFSKTEVIKVNVPVVTEKLVEKDCPAIEFEMPEFKIDARIRELWDKEYSDNISFLEDEAEIVAIEQFKEDNEDFNGTYFFEDDAVFDLVTEGIDCDGDCEVKYIKEYKDREIEVIDLGLDDLDDRLIELSTAIRVKVFTDEDDSSEYFFEKVHIDSTVISDNEDLEAEVIYSI